MKRFGLWVIALALCAATAGRAQDAATEERLRQLSGKIEDLTAGQEALRKRLEELAAQLEQLRDQQNRPAPNYASPEDLKRLAKAIEEVDAKRLEDNRKIRADLLQLIDSVKTAPVVPQKKPRSGDSSSGSKKKSSPPPPDNPADDQDGGSERGVNYTVASGDTLSAIVTAFHEKHILVTEREILKANPGLKPNRLRVGQQLFIPLPQPAGASK
jgi:LysM repeat protein